MPKKRTLAALVLASSLTTACYGQFALTRKIYEWNGRATSNAFANSVIMWGLIIIPVYGLSTLGDIFIFNTIEVFTGSNPIALNGDGSTHFAHEGRQYHLRVVSESGAGEGGQAVEVAVDGKAALRYFQKGADMHIVDLEQGTTMVMPVAQAHAMARPHGTF